jgi:hypothetical protein
VTNRDPGPFSFSDFAPEIFQLPYEQAKQQLKGEGGQPGNQNARKPPEPPAAGSKAEENRKLNGSNAEAEPCSSTEACR